MLVIHNSTGFYKASPRPQASEDAAAMDDETWAEEFWNTKADLTGWMKEADLSAWGGTASPPECGLLELCWKKFTLCT